MNKIRRTICILFIFLSTNFAFSITNDFYVKYQDYIVFDKALSTNTDYEFVVLYSANIQKAKNSLH